MINDAANADRKISVQMKSKITMNSNVDMHSNIDIKNIESKAS